MVEYLPEVTHTMARGNQRELARAKNAKKQQELEKGQKKGDPAKRMENDAAKMREKQAAGQYQVKFMYW